MKIDKGFCGNHSKCLCLSYARYLLDTFSDFDEVRNDIDILETFIKTYKKGDLSNTNFIIILNICYNNILSASTFYKYLKPLNLVEFRILDRKNKLNKIRCR